MNKIRIPWLLGIAFVVLLGLGMVLLESFNPKVDPAAPGKAHSAEEEQAAEPPEEDPWAEAWTNQQAYLTDIAEETDTLRKNMTDITRNLQQAVTPFELDVRRLFVLSTTYAQNPRVLEAVEQRISKAGLKLREAMAPAANARTNAAELLEKIAQLERTVPPDVRSNVASNKGLRTYIDTIVSVKKRLSDIIARLDNALSQGKILEEKMIKAVTAIDGYLPTLWEKHYTSPPVRYVEATHWTNFGKNIRTMMQDFQLRLAMEIPQSKQGWLTATARFASVAFFGGIVSFFLFRRVQRGTGGTAFLHIFYSSLPWVIAGVALIAAALSSSTTVSLGAQDTTASLPIYRGILALGTLMLIVGQISLAWDLRCIDMEGLPRSSPFWPLCLPILAGYVLMYPDLPIALLSLCWTSVLLLTILWRRFRPQRDLSLQLEGTTLQIDTVIVWISLFLVIFGLPRYSIIFYMLFASLAVALQLSVGGMHCIHAFSKHLPQEGTKAVVGSIMVALAAPMVIILAILGVALWVITLPGGTYILRNYAVSGVSVGATHFNVLQLLLIISAFYITRTAVSMGGGFIAKLPKHGLNIDATLIPPLQTAFTYSLWALFGAFVLKALGMELSNLAVVAGGLSVGIGFGMQAIVNNFLSGLILIFSRILQEGDVVDVGGLTGIVRKISVRATTVETYENAVIYVPNAEFVSNRLINWTRNSRSVRREIPIGVAYGTDTALVMRLLREVAERSANVLKYPAPTVLFNNFGNNTLDFSLRFWVHDFDAGVPTASAIRLEIERSFRENNVEVAFPQLDVHLKDVPLSLGGKAQKRPPKAATTTTAQAPRRLEELEGRSAMPQTTTRPGARRLLRRRVTPRTLNLAKE